MAYDGKIAGHFPGRGNPNLDTLRIDYLAEGASTPSSISDMQKVKEVYAVAAGSSISSQNLEDYLVWRYFDELLNDTTQDQYLMFAFKPTRDVSVNSLGIFTDGDGSASTALVICSDDGLLLYKGDNTQESTENTEIYGLSGIKRTRTFNSAITLYAGKTYWIHYHFNNCRNHRGAYFNGFNGHACLGKYKNMGDYSFTSFAQNTAYPQYANSTITDAGSISHESDLLSLVITYPQNTLVKYTHNGGTQIKIRTSTLAGCSTYKGIVSGEHSNNKVRPDIKDITSFKVNDVFIAKNGTSYVAAVWQINSAFPSFGENNKRCDLTSADLGNDNTAAFATLGNLLYEMSTNDGIEFKINTGSYPWPTQSLGSYGVIYKRTSQGSIDGTVRTDVPTGDDLVVGRLYNVSRDAHGWPGLENWRAHLAVYLGNNQFAEMQSFTQTFTTSNGDIQFFTSADMTDYMTDYGPDSDSSNVLLESANVNSNSFIQNWNSYTTYTDKRYYLEINGTERCAGDERK